MRENTDHLGNRWDQGIALQLSDGTELIFSMADLASPQRIRAVVYAGLGHDMPDLTPEQHEQLITVMFELAGYGRTQETNP